MGVSNRSDGGIFLKIFQVSLSRLKQIENPAFEMEVCDCANNSEIF